MSEELESIQRENDILRHKVNQFRAALIEAEEVLDGYADADCQGDPAEYIPNRAMKARNAIREVIWGRDL